MDFSEIKIQEDIFKMFPEFSVGILMCFDINNFGNIDDLKMFRDLEDEVKKLFPTTESIGRHQYIQAWRNAYKRFGADPHRYRCSSEALIRQILKDNYIWGINKIVDIYNYISLKYMLPVGGEDLDKVENDLELCFAKGDEKFTRLGGVENEPPFSGEVIYKDGDGVVCRMWNWREGERTKITDKTENAVIVIDTIGIEGELLNSVLEEMANLVQINCGGEIERNIIHNRNI